MNESVFNALLKLSYFIIKQNDVSQEAAFLISIKDYLAKFNIYIEGQVLFNKYRNQKNSLLPNQKKIQSYYKGEDIKSLCYRFDNELLMHEKFFIAVCLVECTSKCGLYTKKTQEIIRLLVISCGINTREFTTINNFILEKDEQRLIHLSDLYISNSEENINDDLEGAWIEKNRPSEMVNIPKIVCDTLKGKIFFHYQQNLNNILFKYKGEEPLYFNKDLINQGELYLFKNKDKLLFDNKVIIDYKELSNIILNQGTKKAIVFTGKSIEYNSKRQFNTLKSFTFSAKSGSLVGILGGKNSEKQVLTKLLVGELAPDKGNILINGYDITQNAFKIQGLIGYVPSENRLRSGLTIYENYYFIAKLYFRNLSDRRIKELILRVFNELGLQNIISVVWNKQTKENLSELQQRLICLGLEIIKDPAVLVLEEIFDDLTPIETQSLIGVLREQAMKGKLIIASSTPPLLFNVKEFDSVWLFDREGYPIYNGKPDALHSYFCSQAKITKEDSAIVTSQEIWQIINRKEIEPGREYTNKREISPKGWFELYNQKIAPKIKIHGFRNVLPQTKVRLQDLDKQLVVFLKRDLIAFFRQPPLFLRYFLVFVAVAILTGLFCRHSSFGSYSFGKNENLSFFYFLNTINSLVFGIWIGVEAIKREGAFYWLNKLYKLSSISYFSSKISLHCLLLAVLFSFYTFITYAIIGHLSLAVKHSFVYLLIGVAGSTVGYNISIYTKSIRNVYLLAIVLISFQIIFSGQIVPFEKFPIGLQGEKNVPVIADLSLIKWGHEALVVDQAVENKYTRIFFNEEKFLGLSKLYNEIILPELQNKVNNCFYLQNEKEDDSGLRKNLDFIKEEIEKMPQNFDVFPFEFVSSLNVEDFNEGIGMECINYINYIQYYLFEETDNKIAVVKIKTDSISMSGDSLLKEKYYNESIHKIVTKVDNPDEIEFNHNMEGVPAIYPIYISPNSNIGRSHLYASHKLFNGHYIKTFWFNVLVIWLAIGMAYIFLITEFIHYTRNILNKYFKNR